jgi:hypothetical protein
MLELPECLRTGRAAAAAWQPQETKTRRLSSLHNQNRISVLNNVLSRFEASARALTVVALAVQVAAAAGMGQLQ